jgi:hypothetical protein
MSWLSVAIGLGLLAEALVATAFTSFLSQESLVSWGWHIPFLLGLPLGLVGLYIRRQLSETLAFASIAEAGRVEKSPVLTEALVARFADVELNGELVVGPTPLSSRRPRQEGPITRCATLDRSTDSPYRQSKQTFRLPEGNPPCPPLRAKLSSSKTFSTATRRSRQPSWDDSWAS